MADITILPTSRAIRAQQLRERSENRLLSRYLTMGEFLERALVVKGYSRVDDDTRMLLLLEAADFSHFSNLRIERNFFTFTQNATYLFRFFEELSGELVGMDKLEYADTYGDYEEHIEILKELFRRYRTVCDTHEMLDRIFLPKQATLNTSYIRSLRSMDIVVEGYLTNFEIRVLLECAAIIPVQMHFYANTYNTKMQQKLRRIGIDTIVDRYQTINIGERRVMDSVRVVTESEIRCEGFGERLLQVAYVKYKVSAFVDAGIEPEKIVVVLPDERFAEHLRRFDSEKNFNFAMGLGLSQSLFVRKIEAAMAYLETSSAQNRSRVNRMGTDILEQISMLYLKRCDSVDVISLISGWIEAEDEQRVKEIAAEELFYFEKIMPYLNEAPLKSALHLYVNRVKERTIDDVSGGKITVMGVLETRAIQYDGIIVVDFNEGTVPRKSEKDLFLNSATRVKAGLPSAVDRESLQKLYYHNLFQRAKKVAISYVLSAESMPSRFLTQLNIKTEKHYTDAQWADILFKRGNRQDRKVEPVEAAYDFTLRPLSATGLKTYLECKRRFYHRYVEGLQAHEIAKDMPDEHEIGTALHHALRDVYRETVRFNNKDALRSSVEQALDFHSGNTPLDGYLNRLWMHRLDHFFASEIERFEAAEVIACEAALTTQVHGMVLTGQVDRIDRTADGLEVLDYKSGKYPIYTARNVENATDYQLEFYYLLAQQKGDVARCGYYDLKSGKIVEEVFLETKLEQLYGHLQQLQNAATTVFDKTDTLSRCRYCDYTHLCGREL